MQKMYGWTGKIALIDLASSETSYIDTVDYAENYIGGRGIAGKLYWDGMTDTTDAFSADSSVMLMAGPLAGTRAMACSRLVIYGTSALFYPDQCGIASLGGTSAIKMKAAGFDGIVVRGRAKNPVYISVTDNGVAIKDARHLWGRDIPATLQALEKEHRKSAAVCIGPAGENMLRMALLASHNGSFASHGFGAVFGVKNLKAIVIQGSQKPAVARPDELKKLNSRIRSMINGRVLMDPMIGNIDLVKRSPCRGCPAGCSRGTYRHMTGVEEHRKNCASAYFYFDWDKAANNGDASGCSFLATSLCDRLGLCTQELSKLIYWLHACRQEGIVTDELLGVPMNTIGSKEFFDRFAHQLVKRQGFGDMLAEGTMRAAHSLGENAVDMMDGIVEGSGFAADLYNPRYFITNAVFHAMDSNPMPQLHEVCYPTFKWVLWYATDGAMSEISTETFRAIARRFWINEDAVDYSKYEGKGAVAALMQNREYAKETLVACDFFYPIITADGTDDHIGDPSIESKLLSAVTGMDISEEDYYRIGERVYNVQRAIQVREGRPGRKGDVLPEFNFTEPLETDKIYFGMFNPEFMLPGPGGELITRKGAVLERDKFESMLDEYYRCRGWDVETGLQKKQQLEQLELDALIPGLEKINAVK